MTQTLIVLALVGQGLVAQTPDEENPPAPRASPEERLALAERKLEGLEEKASTTSGELDALKKLKLSGYVQARFTVSDTSHSGLDAAGAPAVKDGFSVRRGRLKATYTTSWAQLVLQIDATNKGVALKDAEAHLIEPWTGHKLHLVVGQTKWPFSYEVGQSSSEREFPERTRVVRAFAPGERDRGAKIAGKAGPLFFAAGAFDGNGTDNKGFTGVDNDRYKDAVGRLGLDLDWIALGVSGWYGTTREPKDLEAGTPKENWDRTRLGADVQLYLDLLPLGGTALKGEYIGGETWSKEGVEQFGKEARGYYALLVQSLSTWGAVALRYDWFDGDVDAADDAIGTFVAALIYYFDDSLKLTLAYEVSKSQTAAGERDPEDNLFTAQLQAKF